MKKLRIILALFFISIIVIGLATKKVSISDYISDILATGDEFYSDIYKAYENSEGVKIADEDRIATFDFENFAFIIHYLNDDVIKLSYFEKEDDKYRFSGNEVGMEYNKYKRNEYGGYPHSYNGSSIECDIVTTDAKIPDGYTREIIKLKNENALFVYKISD